MSVAKCQQKVGRIFGPIADSKVDRFPLIDLLPPPCGPKATISYSQTALLVLGT